MSSKIPDRKIPDCKIFALIESCEICNEEMKNGEAIKNEYANRNTPDPRQTFLIAVQQLHNSNGDIYSR